MLQYIGKYWGPEEIIEVRDTGTTTHRGVGILEVVTKKEDGKTRVQTLTPAALEAVAFERATDWNYVQDRKLEKVINELMVVATDNGIFGGELQTMLSRFGLALATRFEHAAHIKFAGNDDEFVPGGSEFFDWSLAKAEHIITDYRNSKREEGVESSNESENNN